MYQVITARTTDGALVSKDRAVVVLGDKNSLLPVMLGGAWGGMITLLSSFQLTPGEGIIGNHPCNALPLSL